LAERLAHPLLLALTATVAPELRGGITRQMAMRTPVKHTADLVRRNLSPKSSHTVNDPRQVPL